MLIKNNARYFLNTLCLAALAAGAWHHTSMASAALASAKAGTNSSATGQNEPNKPGNSKDKAEVKATPVSSMSTKEKKQTERKAGKMNVLVKTNKGEIHFELDKEKAPITTQNFLNYVESKFFDSTIFHRVIGGFMIQGGGFDLDMKQKRTEKPIAIESNNGLKNDRGTIAMARTSDPNSATAQFFINLTDNSFLNYQSQSNPGYAVFGKVTAGMDVVDEIAKTKTGNKGMHSDVPLSPIVIESIRVAQ